MSSAQQQELTASTVISQFESGTYGRDIAATIAQGFLPLPEEDLITVLSWLGVGEDSEVATMARATLAQVHRRALFDYASNETIGGDHLVRLFSLSDDGLLLEALIRNRSVPDASVIELARTAEPRVQDVIVINQSRILRAPEILEALLQNPSVTPDVRRRALETREEFFDKKARRDLEQAEEEAEILDIPLDPIADLLARAAQGQDEGPPQVTLMEGEKKDPKKTAFWAKLQFMSVAERVQLAYRGDRMARMLLVRDRNRLIASAVMRNPRMTEQEVESIAGMRNVEEEVLRLIAGRREWMGKYNVIVTLCRNPKAPLGVVLPFINRLTLRDLKGLKDDKGVPQVVREMARKLFLSRTQKTG